MEHTNDTTLNRYVHYLLGCLMAASENLANALDAYRDDDEVALTFQQTYRYAPKNAPDPFSISTEFRPDFVLIVQRGNQQRLVIFDANYRASDFSIKEALRDMHVYRDAIRSSPAQTAVDAAFILVPDFGLGMSRFFDSDYRTRYRFGRFRLGGEHDEPMVLRTSRKNGSRFWGCPGYPKCRGTRKAA